jgi:endonuclease YncB( thermonuclease family)
MGRRFSHKRGRNVVPYTRRRRPVSVRSVLIAAILTGAVGFSLAGCPSTTTTTIGNVHPPETAPVTMAAKAQPAPSHDTVVGRATVVDGDTIDVGGTRVRFNGIDAPESKQLCQDARGKNYRCGQAATKALDAWLAKSRPVTCTFVEWDRYGRFVGDCYRADGDAAAAWLVGAGHATDWPRHSGGAYANHQAEARQAKRGIWRGEFQLPWEWRAAQQVPKPEATSPVRLLSGSCDIKGNVSKKGERIYHVPGQRFYDETVISSSNGERMFCTEDEARAAGWRRAKR